MVHFDTALNVVWALLGAIALAATTRFAFFGTPVRIPKRRWLHVVGVTLIVAALFPYISATDDVLRIEHLTLARNAKHAGSVPEDRKKTDDLLRLYETLDSPILATACQVCLCFFFLAIILLPSFQVRSRVAPNSAGRSPPLVTA